MKPLIMKITAAEMVSCRAGIPRKILRIAAPMTTRKPTIKNPPRKLKSLWVVSTYPDRAKKMAAVPPRAIAMI